MNTTQTAQSDWQPPSQQSAQSFERPDGQSLASLPLSVDDETQPLLCMQQVSKTLAKSGSSFQLFIPELSVRAGEFVAIVGESGCGKSTLLDLLALISSPTEALAYHCYFSAQQQFDIAELWRQGADTTLAGIRQQYLGYILQTGGLLPYLSVRKNLALPIKIKSADTRASDIVDMAERMGVAKCLSRRPNALSGGQRQRVAILRALMHQPQLVLADEPTAAVDSQRAVAIVEDFHLLAREKQMAILMVTHDVELVRHLADKIYSFQLEDLGEQNSRSTLYQLMKTR